MDVIYAQKKKYFVFFLLMCYVFYSAMSSLLLTVMASKREYRFIFYNYSEIIIFYILPIYIHIFSFFAIWSLTKYIWFISLFIWLFYLCLLFSPLYSFLNVYLYYSEDTIPFSNNVDGLS